MYIKKYCLKIQSTQDSLFFLFVCFCIYRIVDSTDIYKSLNINIGTVMKNPKILKFIPVILKLKRCVSMQLKIFPYLLRYVPDQYKTQQMCDKVNLEK